MTPADLVKVLEKTEFEYLFAIGKTPHESDTGIFYVGASRVPSILKEYINEVITVVMNISNVKEQQGFVEGLSNIAFIATKEELNEQ